MNSVERRLTALEGRTGDEGRVIFAATEADAERHDSLSDKPNLYLISVDHRAPITVGGSIVDLMRHIAEHGRAIHDKERSTWDSSQPALRVWRRALSR